MEKPLQDSLISTSTQNITYNAFNKVSMVNDFGTYFLNFIYGADEQRRMMQESGPNGFVQNTYYIGDYELQTDGNGITQYERTYIWGPEGLIAVLVNDAQGKGENLYYAHTDHLGSVLMLTDANATVAEEYSFDAWGRRRNPTDWSYTNIPSHTLLTRGFTFHEHLDSHHDFGLINMNGRLYDYTIRRFTSPDALALATPNYSMYAYGLDNPVTYTDADGNCPICFVAIAIAINLIIYAAEGNTFQSGWDVFTVGITGYSTGQLKTAWDTGDGVTLGFAALNTALTLIPGGSEAAASQRVATKSAEEVGKLGAEAAVKETSKIVVRQSAEIGTKEVVERESVELIKQNTIRGIEEIAPKGIEEVAPKYFPEITNAPGVKLNFSSEIGVVSKSVSESGEQFTKSSLKLGREIHAEYKLTEHAPSLGRFKEFTGIKGYRPDFVDFGTKTIYELKPYNPRGIELGAKQLNSYKSVFEQIYGGTWKTKLDFY